MCFSGLFFYSLLFLLDFFHIAPEGRAADAQLTGSGGAISAVGGDGLLEVDCNPNPLRELLAAPFPRLRDGRFLLSDAPGLGVAPDMEAVEKLLTFHARCR